MKRLSKIFLVAGLILFGLSGFTGCAGEVSGSSDTPSEQGGGAGDGGGNLSDPNHIDEVDVDFSQSTIPGSTYTYPATVDHVVHPKEPDVPAEFTAPTYHLSEATGSSSDAPGASVKSKDNIITVTPYYDGLHIVIDYNTTEESKTWKHNSLQIKNVTDNQAPIEVGVDVDEIELKSEFTFTFTEKNKTYKVWLTHMDIDWHDWGTTEPNAAEVTAIGGSGTVNAVASDIRIEKDLNDKRIIHMNNLTITGPVIPDSLDVYVRAENGSQWGKGAVCEPSVSFKLAKNKNYINTYTDSNDDLNTFLAGKQYLFIILSYKFKDANGKEHKQDIYSNYDKWISDCVEWTSVPEYKFPLIKITSKAGTNYFVTEPIASHVKDTAHDWEDADYLEAIPDPWYEDCTIGVNDGTPVEGQVKVRGNWTTSYDKKSLRIKFKDKQNLCNLHDGKDFKNWVLLAVWKDSSFLRDAVGLKMFKKMFSNYYASDCTFVEVEVNGEYMGVYLLAEQQEVKKNRINITDTDKATGTDIGYFIEFDQFYTSEAENERFEIKYGGPIKDYYGKVLEEVQKGYTIKSDINNAAQKEFIMKYMNRLWTICYQAVYNKKYYKFTDNLTLAAYTPEGDTDDKKCENCISAVIDVKSLADMYIFNELVCDPDLYLTSFLMDIDFGEGKDRKLRFEAPWDFDSTMGNKRHCADAQGMYAGKAQKDVNFEDGSEHCGNPWMVIFIKQAWFQKLVKDQWAAINATSVLRELTSYIDTYSSSNYEEVFNYTRIKWGTAIDNSELCPESKIATATSQKASADYLKEWLTSRFTAVESVISSLSTN